MPKADSISLSANSNTLIMKSIILLQALTIRKSKNPYKGYCGKTDVTVYLLLIINTFLRFKAYT